MTEHFLDGHHVPARWHAIDTPAPLRARIVFAGKRLKEATVQWLWTWGGVSFGYRDGDNLWTHDGRHVGRFHGIEVYGPNGSYLGEQLRPGRLITDVAKRAERRPPFFPSVRRHSLRRRPPSAAESLPPAYFDFPEL
jgi:hypothetical protein